MRGDGRLFHRKGTAVLQCAYFHKGKEIRESTHQTDRAKAQKFLNRRVKEVHADQIGARSFIGPAQERIQVGELLDALKADYELRGKDSQQNLSNLKRAKQDFGHIRALGLTAEMVDRYIQQRRAEGSADASINRVTQLRGQGYKLAVARKRLTVAPTLRRLSEIGNARRGFFGESEFRAVLRNLPPHLADLVLFLYLSGWRKGEAISLTWEDVELDEIRLRPEHAKNGCARSVPLVGELGELIDRRRTLRVVKTANEMKLAALVFHHDGEPIGDFRKAWATACRMAGVAGKLVHDLRRSAVRNMVRAGVPTDVARSISGHKTASIFSRYNIVAEEQKREALERTQAYLRNVQEQQPAAISRAQ